MSHAITHKSAIILLVGAGPTNTNMILSAAAHTSSLIAADGGFKAATDAGLDVTLVIGDMDSQSEPLGSQNVLTVSYTHLTLPTRIRV